jgi:hypothetical protein
VVDEAYEHPGREFTSYYEETKLEAHRIAKRMIAEETLPCVIVQPGGVYGPDDTSQVADLLEQFFAGRLPLMPFPAQFGGPFETTASFVPTFRPDPQAAESGGWKGHLSDSRPVPRPPGGRSCRRIWRRRGKQSRRRQKFGATRPTGAHPNRRRAIRARSR